MQNIVKKLPNKYEVFFFALGSNLIGSFFTIFWNIPLNTHIYLLLIVDKKKYFECDGEKI